MTYSHPIMQARRTLCGTIKPKVRRRTGRKVRKLLSIAQADASRYHRWRRSTLPSGGVEWLKAWEGDKPPRWEDAVTAFYGLRYQWEQEAQDA